jgi:membrane carboxypeptidase/penicillin-binding protein
VLLLIGAVALLFAMATSWFMFDSSDLPDTTLLGAFAPDKWVQLHGACLSSATIAIPFQEINSNLRNTMAAAGGGIDSETVLYNLLQWNKEKTSGRGPRSLQIARTLFCESHDAALIRHIKELRLAAQLDRRYSREQLFTIELNRASFGDCGNGIQNAAQCLFHKDAPDLKLAEGALVVAMMARPSYDFPFRHPDRALSRRNFILESLASEGKLSPQELKAAESQPLIH